nr:DNA helicase [Tanacetum cinerariifolium]
MGPIVVRNSYYPNPLQVVHVLYTVEFQKRGLPYCHTLLWIDESIHVHQDEHIDTYVSSELPSQHIDPQGHRIVSELMMHGPCGLANPSATCCTSFPGICTVNNIVYPTCRAACDALGLLQDNREWEVTLQEAALTVTPAELRALLAHIFAYCDVSNPKKLWERTWNIMSEDIPYICSISLNLPGLHIDDSDLKDYMLYEFKACLNHYSKSLIDFGLCSPPAHLMSAKHFCGQLFYTQRCEGKIVLAIASSGIASLLLPADVRNGQIGNPDDSDPDNTSWVDIPDEYCIADDDNAVPNLINFIYDADTLRYPSAQKLQEKAIVCPKNDTWTSLMTRSYPY